IKSVKLLITPSHPYYAIPFGAKFHSILVSESIMSQLTGNVWTSWSSCDVTCGNTTLTRTRSCTNPPPTNHGKNCTGETVQHKDCVLDHCPGTRI
ncbi:LOW QUALITY PROTEIN: SSPO-like protein, partial [Mya arenaria]